VIRSVLLVLRVWVTDCFPHTPFLYLAILIISFILYWLFLFIFLFYIKLCISNAIYIYLSSMRTYVLHNRFWWWWYYYQIPLYILLSSFFPDSDTWRPRLSRLRRFLLGWLKTDHLQCWRMTWINLTTMMRTDFFSQSSDED